MTPQTLTRGRRVVAGSTVAALTAGALALAPAAHAADAPTATLQWKISQQFVDHFTPGFGSVATLVGSDGATVGEDGTTTFGAGTGTHTSGGATSVQYDGTVTGSYIRPNTGGGGGTTTYYTIAISDPQVTVDASGRGEIVADVAWTVPNTPAPSGSTADVTVVTFNAAAGDWNRQGALVSLTDTPNFLGVLPAGSPKAVELGLTTEAKPNDPVNGGSFDPEFIAALPSSLRGHFYLSGASGDPKKPAAAFTATVPAAGAPAVANVSTRYAKGGTVSVTAPIAGRVTVAGLGTQTAAAGQTVRFALPRTLAAGTRRYAVSLTPSAAGISASSTTVTVKIAKVAAYKAKIKVTKKPTRKAKGKAIVSVKGVSGGAAPTGKVRLKLTKGKTNRYVNVNLVRGKRTVSLPRLAKGTWTVRAAYYGNANYTKRGYAKIGSIKVTK